MKVELKTQSGREITITNEVAASSYGLPVAIIDGQAYGPKDIVANVEGDVLEFLHERAEMTVAGAMIDAENLTEEEKIFVRKFTQTDWT